ncbi:G-protein beta WD-40 repeat [Ostreococcus tauri]|uniref:G-protein beta WD-40 repeat n=1 Tax=Ostreococcus tauri TaxID=70448 RepID=A0A090LYB2_OSTTA|nr:G-protein beta WD-40 repeat [Ostreococcus tauri]OUS42396.1 WD40 repeat-containing protein [Ostreococcus tauri]CEF96885.1 G-protein beta WD-40 repeat [Ostreococcus tauri]|eukprot:XP_003074641.2 G-protein beta WD-40 repeat [Ostreococcus tauri]
MPLTLALARELTGAHARDAVLAITFSRDGAHCVTCGRDRAFALWSARTGTLLRAYRGGHGREVRDASCARDGGTIATCGGDRGVYVWDVATGAARRRFEGHDGDGGTNAVTFCANDCVVVSAGYDASVRVWDVRANGGRAMQILNARTGVGFEDSVTSLTRDEAWPRIACGCVDGATRVVDIRRGELHVDAYGVPVTSVSFSRDNKCLAVGCLTSRVCLAECATGDGLNTYRGHVAERAKTQCALTSDDAHVVSGSEDGRVVFWDVVTAEIVAEIDAHDPSSVVCGVDVSPPGVPPALATCATDGRARLWTITSDR